MSTQLAPILQELLDATTARIGREKEVETEEQLRRQVLRARTPHRFHFALSGRGYGWPKVVAEVKRASPSEGDIAPNADPVAVARAYDRNGAGGISVLTEPTRFKGDKQHLRDIREALPKQVHLLMKDFIIDWYQLLQARVYGADMVLLIVDFVPRDLLADLFVYATKWLDLTPLVEVHDADQLEFAMSLGATLIGVNNRDLRTMKTNLATSEELGKLVRKYSAGIKARPTFITESGIHTGADIQRLAKEGYQGFLVGTVLMKQRFPGGALARLLNDAQPQE